MNNNARLIGFKYIISNATLIGKFDETLTLPTFYKWK